MYNTIHEVSLNPCIKILWKYIFYLDCVVVEHLDLFSIFRRNIKLIFGDERHQPLLNIKL